MLINRKSFKFLIVLTAFHLGANMIAHSSEISRIAKWKGNAPGAISITIDDNGPGNMRDVQASILEEHGVRGTFNIVTGFLPTSPSRTQMFLNIFNRGHELASHTVTHSRLKGADTYLIWQELSDSKSFIEELTGAPCITYAAAYGDLDPNVIEVAQELYISARGIQAGISDLPDGGIWNLKVAYHPTPWGATWTNEQYISGLRQYADDVVAVEGWGVEMWHDITNDPNDPNKPSSGAVINETVFRTHLLELTSDYENTLWIAPQGQVARYYWERQATTVNSYTITDNVILVDLLFDGDKSIFNEPLTIVTNIPAHWLEGNITVTQNSLVLDYITEQEETVSRLVYDAMPDGGAVSLVFEGAGTPKKGDLDGDGDVDIDDLLLLISYWLEENPD